MRLNTSLTRSVCWLLFWALAFLVSVPTYVFAVEDQRRTGTAFAVTSDGHLVTSAHLLKGAKEIKISAAQSGQSFNAKLVALDEGGDLALLKTELRTVPIAVSDFSGVPNGLEVFALGFPLPSFQGKELKVTSGIINARTGLRGAPGSFQFSAPIQSGNSGGPVIAADGSMVGVIHGKLAAKPQASRASSEKPENVSFAADSNAVADFLALHGVYIIRQTIKLTKVLRPHEIFEQVQSSVFFVEVTFESPEADETKFSLVLRRLMEAYSKEDQARLLGVYLEGFREILRSKKETLLLRNRDEKSIDKDEAWEPRYNGPVEGRQFQLVISFDESKRYKDQFEYQSLVLDMAYDCLRDASVTLFREYKEHAFAGGRTRLKLMRKPLEEWDPTAMKPVKSLPLKKFLRKNLCDS